MIRRPKHCAPVPIETLQFDFSDVGNRFGLPIVRGPGLAPLPWGELPIFEVPALVARAPGNSAEDISWPWGLELATMSMVFCRAMNTEGEPRRLSERLQLSSGVDFPHLIRANLRVGLASPVQAYFAALSIWLEHAAVCDSSLIHASELDALIPEIAETRLRSILRGERVPEPWLKHSLID